jgi:hypothetical protein
MAFTFKQSHVITDPKARMLWMETGDHGDRCQVCHRPWARAGWRGFAVHHIIRGANGRSDEPCNFLLVCARCHDMIHDGVYRDERTKELLPAITLGMVLWIKSHTDEWDESRLTELYHRRLPEWQVLDQYYMTERTCFK